MTGHQRGSDLETVGAVALDIYGNLATAGSTGGLTGKLEGRIGDAAIVGAGLHADQEIAVVCSGAGDDILRNLVASKVALLHKTHSLNQAAVKTITGLMVSSPATCAVSAISSEGQIAVHSSGRAFLFASASPSTARSSYVGTDISIYPQHMCYENELLIAGITRYPTATGHTVVHVRSGKALMDLSCSDFMRVMESCRSLAQPLQ